MSNYQTISQTKLSSIQRLWSLTTSPNKSLVWISAPNSSSERDYNRLLGTTAVFSNVWPSSTGFLDLCQPFLKDPPDLKSQMFIINFFLHKFLKDSEVKDKFAPHVFHQLSIAFLPSKKSNISQVI